MTDENAFDAMTERLRAQGLPTDTHPEGSLKPVIEALSELSDSSGSFAGPGLPDVLAALQDSHFSDALCALPTYADAALPVRPVVMDEALVASMHDALGIPPELRGRTTEFAGSSIGMRHAVLVGNRIHSGIEAAIQRVLKDHPEILRVDEAEVDTAYGAQLRRYIDDAFKKDRAIDKSTNTLASFEGFLENARTLRATQSARPIVSVGRYRSDKERARAKAAKKSRRKNRK